MKKGIFILNESSYSNIYGPDEQADIREHIEIYAPPQTKESVTANLDILREAEIIFGGWGMAKLDESLLAAAPRLEAVFYGAGSIKHYVTEAFWERDILISSALAGNADAVAEFTLSQILFCLKRGWHFALGLREGRLSEWELREDGPGSGAYGTVVGIISLGTIGQAVCRLLQHFQVKLLAYDPFASQELAEELHVELCSLEELFQQADVVSLHTPWLKETEGMISGKLLSSMKPCSSFINTARGAVVREDELIETLKTRPDIQACLDVTWPEPPELTSELFSLPNAIVTPHIAGARGLEGRRMGRIMVEELRRYLQGESLRWRISRDMIARMA